MWSTTASCSWVIREKLLSRPSFHKVSEKSRWKILYKHTHTHFTAIKARLVPHIINSFNRHLSWTNYNPQTCTWNWASRQETPTHGRLFALFKRHIILLVSPPALTPPAPAWVAETEQLEATVTRPERARSHQHWLSLLRNVQPWLTKWLNAACFRDKHRLDHKTSF